MRGSGLADDAAKRLGRLAPGHPLTLRLAAAAALARRELGVHDTRLLDPEARELVIDGRRVPLTRTAIFPRQFAC